LFALLAVLTMTVGNLTALFQNNVKRLLAYSSIAQAGYMLLGFVAADSLGRDGVLLYSIAYVFMNLGAFTVAIMVGNGSSYELEAYDGLAIRNFPVALLMAFFLLSLAGIPPTAGFIAKFYVFGALINGKWYALAVAGVLNSVISVYYYLRIVYHMYFRSPATTTEPGPLRADLALYLSLGLAALGVFVIGIYPDPFITAARASVAMLPQAVKLSSSTIFPTALP
jgi:NADH-quinone oxidoreductase subunit N